MEKKIGFAVVGLGRMGLRRISLIKSCPSAALRCVEDYIPGIAKEIGDKEQVEYLTGWEKAVSRDDVDCVMVSMPNKFHREIVVAALESGKHVFCEKPLARNPSEALDMVRAAGKSGRFLKVGSNLRFFPSTIKAKDMLDSGEIGNVLFARGWIGHGGWQIGSWYSDPDIIGGGTILDNGCHMLDLYRWFLGEPESCMGLSSTTHWNIKPLDDNTMGIFRFSGNKMAFLHSSWTEWEGYMYLEIYGSEGLIRIDNRKSCCLTQLVRKDGSGSVYDFTKDTRNSYTIEFENYIDSITRGTQPLPSGHDGLRAVEMAHGIYQSSLEGKEVKL